MTIVGKSRSFYKGFLFTVELDGVGSAAFQKCSEISAECAVIQQWEGGRIIAQTSPGRVTIPPITLDRGATKDRDLFMWWKQVADIAEQTGLVDDDYKRTGSVVQRDRDGSERMRWNIFEVWPSKFVAGAWDNTADANTMEQVVLQYSIFRPSDVP